MKFFSHEWASSEDTQAVERTIGAYATAIGALEGPVGNSIRDFVRKFDLRGALLDTLEVNTVADAVSLGLVTGDMSQGYFKLTIGYRGCRLREPTLRRLGDLVRRRDVQTRFDEFDRAVEPIPQHHVHRLLFWPRKWGEIEVPFTGLYTQVVAISGRKYSDTASPVDII